MVRLEAIQLFYTSYHDINSPIIQSVQCLYISDMPDSGLAVTQAVIFNPVTLIPSLVYADPRPNQACVPKRMDRCPQCFLGYPSYAKFHPGFAAAGMPVRGYKDQRLSHTRILCPPPRLSSFPF